MRANFASIMPQIIACWCEEQGHDVTLLTYTGPENILSEMPDKMDLVFIGSFTEAALLAYALSNLFRKRGAVTVIGGPHARCYPQDSQKYFDYVLGFTDKELILNILDNCVPHRPVGQCLSANRHPVHFPGVEQRWKFIEQTLRKAPFIKLVPLLSSLGCPYSCEFCIDSSVPYQPLDTEALKQDLRFLLGKFKRPRVAWHDPNFGIKFDECMDAIEEAVPPGRMDFIAESSLAILSEKHLTRLKHNGFKALLPGIESWFNMGNKSRTAQTTGMAKVKRISEHINVVLKYVPYVQTNHIVGLDGDEGAEPFELTKSFLDLSPGAFPGYSLLSAFGQAAPLNLKLQQDNRVLAFPFHLLSNSQMNVRPKHYSWPELYDRLIDLTEYSFSSKMILRRLAAGGEIIPRLLNVIRACSSEGFGRIKYFTEIRNRLKDNTPLRRFFEQETTEIPKFFVDKIRTELGPFWDSLPPGALYHDPNAYLHSQRNEYHPAENRQTSIH